jgi:tetratricopeptide (TPR) repeat protein
VAQEELGRATEAERSFRLAIEADPAFALSHKGLGRRQEARGDLAGALASYRLAVEHAPADAEARLWLGRALAASGDGVGALEHLRAAADLAPDAPQALLTMADLLAGYPDAAVRRPDEAVRLATRAVELTRRRDPVALLSLTNALGAAGRVPQAIEAGEEALAIARQTGPAQLARAIESRLTQLRRTGR